jgi:hypothetical protein
MDTDLALDIGVLGVGLAVCAVSLAVYLHRRNRAHLFRLEGATLAIEGGLGKLSDMADELINIGRAQGERLVVLETQVTEIGRKVTLAPALVQATRADAAKTAEQEAWRRLNPVAKAAQRAGSAVSSVVNGLRGGLGRVLHGRRRQEGTIIVSGASAHSCWNPYTLPTSEVTNRRSLAPSGCVPSS